MLAGECHAKPGPAAAAGSAGDALGSRNGMHRAAVRVLGADARRGVVAGAGLLEPADVCLEHRGQSCRHLPVFGVGAGRQQPRRGRHAAQHVRRVQRFRLLADVKLVLGHERVDCARNLRRDRNAGHRHRQRLGLSERAVCLLPAAAWRDMEPRPALLRQPGVHVEHGRQGGGLVPLFGVGARCRQRGLV